MLWKKRRRTRLVAAGREESSTKLENGRKATHTTTRHSLKERRGLLLWMIDWKKCCLWWWLNTSFSTLNYAKLTMSVLFCCDWPGFIAVTTMHMDMCATSQMEGSSIWVSLTTPAWSDANLSCPRLLIRSCLKTCLTLSSLLRIAHLSSHRSKCASAALSCSTADASIKDHLLGACRPCPWPCSTTHAGGSDLTVPKYFQLGPVSICRIATTPVLCSPQQAMIWFECPTYR